MIIEGCIPNYIKIDKIFEWVYYGNQKDVRLSTDFPILDLKYAMYSEEELTKQFDAEAYPLKKIRLTIEEV